MQNTQHVYPQSQVLNQYYTYQAQMQQYQGQQGQRQTQGVLYTQPFYGQMQESKFKLQYNSLGDDQIQQNGSFYPKQERGQLQNGSGFNNNYKNQRQRKQRNRVNGARDQNQAIFKTNEDGSQIQSEIEANATNSLFNSNLGKETDINSNQKPRKQHKDSFDFKSEDSTDDDSENNNTNNVQQPSFSKNSQAHHKRAQQNTPQQGRPRRQQGKGQQYQEATLKKPKKVFNSEEERDNFVRSYQIKYKTEMCRNWELFKKCKFQDKCSFAHGDHEIHKKVHLPSNYKTKICTQFHEEMYCPYGNRCQFLHSQYDIAHKDFDYETRLLENVRISMDRVNTLKEGQELSNIYVNVFEKRQPASRLGVFNTICKV